jgi:hypothetical protein
MLDSSTRSLSGLLHAAGDLTIAAVAGGLVVLVFYPLTLVAAGVKGLLRIVRLRPSPPGQFAADKGKKQRCQAQERAEREFVS